MMCRPNSEAEMQFETIEVCPMAGAMGAEIRGIDLSKDLSNQQRSEIHRAFLDNSMIYFRHQELPPRRQVEVARLFGKPAIYPFLKGLDEAPEVNALIKTEKDTVNFGGGWHSDTTYKQKPDMGTLLYAVEVPEFGGDTLFASMYAAYEALSSGMKKFIDPLVGVNSSEKLYKGGRAAAMQELSGMKGAFRSESTELIGEHPVVRTHPETGRKALYVNRAHTVRFKDATEDECRSLIDYLSAHAVRPEFTCRLRWEPGTLAIWDNRCTQHMALNDYQGKRRHMHRVTIEGDIPR
jgi:taurine dioxygenase